MDPYVNYNRRSKGFLSDPPARLHPNILFGAGSFLNQHFIKKHGITHVINCASEKDVPSFIPELLKEKYCCIHAIDSLNVDITEWYPVFEKYMDEFLRSEECNVVYVNCQAGINRSGFLTLLYCCMKFQYSYEKACKAALQQRPCALSNRVFHKQVKEYIKNHA